MQPAMKAGNPAKGKPAQATEHGEVEDHKAHRCRDFDHGDQIVDPPGPHRWRCSTHRPPPTVPSPDDSRFVDSLAGRG